MNRKTFLLALLAMMLPLMAQADITQTTLLDGTTVGKWVGGMAFDGDNVTLTFDDGTTMTADMESVSISFAYDDDATGISEIKTDNKDAEGVYTVSGQYMGRSTDNLEKGIYIVGGKKLIIK